MIRSAPSTGQRSRRGSRHLREVFEILHNPSLPSAMRQRLLVAVGRELGMEVVAALLESVRVDGSSAQASLDAAHFVVRDIRPWSSESEEFLYLARDQLEVAQQRRMERQERRRIDT